MSRPSEPTPNQGFPDKLGEHSNRRRSRPFKAPKKVDARFKRDLLRGAFEENLDLIQDQPLGTTRRTREQRWKRLKKWFLGSTGVLGAVLGLIFLTGLAQGGSPREPLVPAPRLHAAIDHSDTHELPMTGRAALMIPGVLPLAVHTIAIDPGHGGIDGGTSINFGMVEKDLTLDIGLRLKSILQDRGLSVIMTRTQDVGISLAERARIANSARADLFVSVHVNWLPKRSARGFETYYLGASDDPFLTRLAQRENLNSGYTLADSRHLLDAIYKDSRRKSSRKLAQDIQSSLYEVLSRENRGVISRGVMQAPFVVLVATDMPAVLAEVACLSNDREARQLAIPSYRQNIATFWAYFSFLIDNMITYPAIECRYKGNKCQCR